MDYPINKKRHCQTVPLVPMAIEILTKRKQVSSNHWGFPGVGRTGHIVEPKRAWRRILERAGLKVMRIHDLRRTLGSWQAASGTSLHSIGKSLGHQNVSTTAIYSRGNLNPVRESVKTATQAMVRAGGLLHETDMGRLKNPIPQMWPESMSRKIFLSTLRDLEQKLESFNENFNAFRI